MKTTLLFLSVFLSANLFGQNVYIPDANFKSNLIGNSEINTNGDTQIQVSEANAYTGGINCFGQAISDLTGIEAFTALTELDCGANNLTSMDVTTNTALEVLGFAYNGLTSLDVSSNTALTELECNNNQLTSLDVSSNTALTELNCGNNQLISLDVSNNTALTELNCCNNQLTSLDVSTNTTLISLDCSLNQLTSLDLTTNNALEVLYCPYNELTSLDLSSNTALTELGCYFNELECLNVKNGNNTAFVSYYAEYNQNLTCIEVDDAEWSASNWTSVDSQTSFSENCNNDCSNSTIGINELTTTKNLIQILDMMGRETPFKPNKPLIYVYDDGSTEKVFSVEY